VPKCISATRVCNKINDCGDNSDEKNCFVDHCGKERPPCHYCTNTKTGFTCSCRTGFKLVNITKCVDIDECSHHIDNGCSQLCANTPGKNFLSISFIFATKNLPLERCRDLILLAFFFKLAVLCRSFVIIPQTVFKLIKRRHLSVVIHFKFFRK
jgi:hypothetical protein